MRNDIVLSRLQNLIGREPSQNEIVKKTGIKQSNLSSKATRNSNWADEEIELLNNAFDVDIYKNITHNNAPDIVKLNFYPDVFASCGFGSYALSENKERIEVPKKCFVKPFSEFKQYSVIIACGDSMETTICNKDRLIVEHIEHGEQIKDNSIYVFCYGDEIYVKRLSKNIDEIIIKSDNPDPIYKTKFIQGEDMNKINIIGEIVGLMRDLR